jgi:hypothetical protein
MSHGHLAGRLAAASLVLSLFAAAPSVAAPAPDASSAAAKKCKKGYKRSAKTGKCVKVKVVVPKIPVTVDFLEGSKAMIDAGQGVVRDVPLSGRLSGYSLGKIVLTKPINVSLTGGTIKPAPSDLLTADCNGTQVVSARLNAASSVKLDTLRSNTASLNPATGVISSSAATIIRYALDVAQSDCTQPLVPAGYSDLPAAFTLRGKLDPKTGLSALVLESPPVSYNAGLCTTPGDPLQPCGGALTQMPITIATHLVARVNLSLG